MKKLFKIIILLFIYKSTLSSADEINNLEIEGMSVGSSLLNYITEQKITKLIKSPVTAWYPNKTFAVIGLKSKNFNIYDDVGIVIRPYDKNYKIYALEGTIYYKRNISQCRKDQEKISTDLKELFDKGTYKFLKNLNLDYIDDKTGESKVSYYDFYFKDNSAVRVICWDMSESLNAIGREDSLAVAVNSKIFMDWIDDNM